MFVMLPGIYIGVGSSNVYRGLWQSCTVIALVATFSKVVDLDHFKWQFWLALQ